MNKPAIVSSMQGKQNHDQYLPRFHQPQSAFPPVLGSSEQARKVKQQILYASQVRLPIFISGETGTEKRLVAQTIHQQRHFTSGQFISIPSQIHGPEEFRVFFRESIDCAINGTLYLAEIDKLSEQHKDYLAYVFSNHDIYRQLSESNTQLIISCEQSLAKQPHFLSRLLGNAMPYLELNIPSLVERAEDIPDYIDYFLHKFGGEQSPKMALAAKQRLSEFAWPQNVAQLQKVMMMLVSSHRYEIHEHDVTCLDIPLAKKPNSDLIESLLCQNLESYQHIHPALYKSLEYLSRSFREEVSLQDLSNASFSSPSHLSYLFRHHLNRSFKNILVELRTQYAKKLISDQPLLKITDVCLQSGFGDLSHFEKMFKRYVGSTPRKYRDAQRQIKARLIS